MILQVATCFKPHSTETTLIWSSAAVYTLVSLQVAGIAETLIAHRTSVRLFFRVDSHVLVQTSRGTKRLVTHVAFVRFLSAVNSTVSCTSIGPRKSFATDSTFKRFLSRVTAPVHSQLCAAFTAPAAFRALVLTGVNIHMLTQDAPRDKTLLTLTARIPLRSVRRDVSRQVFS